jgi:hypothetical protein
VLLTLDNLADRSQYLNARNTFTELLRYGAIPVVNENVGGLTSLRSCCTWLHIVAALLHGVDIVVQQGSRLMPPHRMG